MLIYTGDKIPKVVKELKRPLSEKELEFIK